MPNTALVELDWFGAFFATLFGLTIGSFLNVVIHRLPRGESIVSPGSRCPRCRRPVPAYDNVPVLSYVLLLGRCRSCRSRISPRYPLVEALVGTASLTSFLRHGASLEFAAELGFVAGSVALIFIDYDHQILPDRITLPGALLGLALAGPRDAITMGQAFGGAALGAGSLFLVSEIYFRVRGVEGLGFGDVKMMAMVGAYVGWRGVLLTVFLGSLSGSLVGILVLARNRGAGDGMKTKLPFGTFLGLGAIATVYVGAFIIEWYAELF